MSIMTITNITAAEESSNFEMHILGRTTKPGEQYSMGRPFIIFRHVYMRKRNLTTLQIRDPRPHID